MNTYLHWVEVRMTKRCQSSNVVGGQYNGIPMLHEDYTCYICMTVDGHGMCLGGTSHVACHGISCHLGIPWNQGQIVYGSWGCSWWINGGGWGPCSWGSCPEQTFHLVQAMKLLDIMLRNKCLPTTFYTITARNVNKRCLNWLVWLVPQLHISWCECLSGYETGLNERGEPTSSYKSIGWSPRL